MINWYNLPFFQQLFEEMPVESIEARGSILCYYPTKSQSGGSDELIRLIDEDLIDVQRLICLI